MGANSLVTTAARRALSKFVDTARVRFQGGRGGDGCISMLQLFANDKAGPDGGDGGHGGHVVLLADEQVKSLAGVKARYQAECGEPGRSKSQFGRRGRHLFVPVPVGTLVSRAWRPGRGPQAAEPDESELVAELDRPGSMFIAARGGSGGHGNAFYLSNKNRHPRLAERGAEGEQRLLELRMRLFAHVGLIGLPNAGKSTLLARLTGARVQVGDYAFTTRHPQLGVIEYDDYTQVAVSDLPGLVEQSHRNRGLGLAFLRSVRRCACLLFVLDLSEQPVGQLELLRAELDHFRPGMSARPHLIWANKLDHPAAGAHKLAGLRAHLARRSPRSPLLAGSGLTGQNLAQLVPEIRRLHDEYLAKHRDEPSDALVW